MVGSEACDNEGDGVVTGGMTGGSGNKAGGRCRMGNVGEGGTDIRKGSGTWSCVSMVGDGEARKRAPAGLIWNDLDMVCWDSRSPIKLALYDFST